LSLKLNKVLVIYKKSTFQIQAVEHRESHFIKLLEEESDTVTRVKVAHQEHYSALDAVRNELTRRQINFDAMARVDVTGPISGVDLVISVGGDGTFLDASHFLEDVPLLGVNSSRSSSFGHFCLANEANLAQVLDDIDGGREPCELLRMELQLNGSVLPELVLNEVLICHSNPAGTSRYFIEIDGQREEQRSSGIWVGPPAGSTGAIRAAGGVILPITEGQYQYIVREPGPRPSETYHLLKDLLPRTTDILVTSQMRTGALYIDGQHIDYRFPLGDELVIRASKNDLRAFVNPTVNDIFRNGHV
jgi:NAD+ kinase